MTSRIMCATQPVCNAHILLSLHLHCTFSAAPPAAQLTVPEVLALAGTTAKGGWGGEGGGGEGGGRLEGGSGVLITRSRRSSCTPHELAHYGLKCARNTHP